MAHSAADKRSWWKKHFGKLLFGVLLIGIIFSLIPIIFYIIHYPGPISNAHSSWGVFGDFIGGTIGPTLSFLALMALLLTLYLQREELENSVKELSNSSRALEQSSNSFKLQNFDRSFFSLTTFLSQTSDNFKFKDPRFFRPRGGIRSLVEGESATPKPRIYNGFEAFGFLYGNMKKHYKSIDNEGNNKQTKINISNEYSRLNKGYINDLYHYFGVLELIFKLIDKSEIAIDKSFYIEILRSQSSVDQLNLLFYFLIWEQQSFNRSDLLYYVNKYNFFEDYDVKLLILPPEHFKLISDQAYGKNLSDYEEDIKDYIELNNNPEAES